MSCRCQIRRLDCENNATKADADERAISKGTSAMVKTAAKANAVWTGDYCEIRCAVTNSHPAGLPPTFPPFSGDFNEKTPASRRPGFRRFNRSRLRPSRSGRARFADRRLHPSAIRPRPYSRNGRRRPLVGADRPARYVGGSGRLRRHDGLRLRTGSGWHRTCPSSSRQSLPPLSRSACWSPR